MKNLERNPLLLFIVLVAVVAGIIYFRDRNVMLNDHLLMVNDDLLPTTPIKQEPLTIDVHTLGEGLEISIPLKGTIKSTKLISLETIARNNPGAYSGLEPDEQIINLESDTYDSYSSKMIPQYLGVDITTSLKNYSASHMATTGYINYSGPLIKAGTPLETLQKNDPYKFWKYAFNASWITVDSKPAIEFYWMDPLSINLYQLTLVPLPGNSPDHILINSTALVSCGLCVNLNPDKELPGIKEMVQKNEVEAIIKGDPLTQKGYDQYKELLSTIQIKSKVEGLQQ